ncbi:MAG: glycosyltransferase family 2 protein, partial [Acidobacteria bacterium]|nr:glycosyltransferase family 2 protein [Acidobacteriota bacterium]
MSRSVLVAIVTHNSGRYLRDCLKSLAAQTHPGFSVSLWDNASADESQAIASEYSDLIASLRLSSDNVGFCGAHNRLIRDSKADFVLVLNPDVALLPDFIAILVEALAGDPTAGSATGRLWRWPEGGPESAAPLRVLDTTGIYFTPNQRHLDRGAGEPDRGQYQEREYVFGTSGAAGFYRRAMLEDIRAGAEYFDEAFFAYREDADLAWRAQWMGWRCLYVPEARGYHARRVLPERRASLPAAINMHSFKNRFLMRVKNMDLGTYLRFFPAITGRDLLALGYVLLRERSSLRGFALLRRELPRAWSVRRALRRHRRAAPEEIRRWFSYRPVSFPAGAVP